jgi:cold shock CspA family protein
MSSETFEGTIKFVDPTGWGLIIPFAELEEQVFFHASKVVGCEFASLRRRDKVIFQLAKRVRQGRRTAASLEFLTRRSRIEDGLPAPTKSESC